MRPSVVATLVVAALSSALSSALLAGCAAGAADPVPRADAQGSAPPKPTTVEAYCQARAEAECTEVVRARCKSKSVASCVAGRIVACKDAVPQGDTFVAANVDGCLAAVKEAYADAKLSKAELTAIADACGPKLFSGPGVARAPCTSDFDCATVSGLVCVHALDGSGKCLAPHRVQPAQTCANEDDVCTAGFFCEGKAKTCQPKAALGEQCFSAIPCADGMYCIASPFGGGCRAKAGAGEGCKLDDDCATGLCDKLSGGSAGNCTDALDLNPLGATCVGFP
ncbi:MAG: hypothetical protein NVSMB47_03390 [Polyangiales bacterium]